jgi:hypothetical protein
MLSPPSRTPLNFNVSPAVRSSRVLVDHPRFHIPNLRSFPGATSSQEMPASIVSRHQQELANVRHHSPQHQIKKSDFDFPATF